MQTNLVRRFKTLGLICLFTSFAGVIYQLIDEKRLDYNSVLLGFPLGLVFGLLELLLFAIAEKRFRQWPFTRMLVFKVLLYSVLIFLVAGSISIIAGLSAGHHMNDFYNFLKTPEPWVLIFYTLVIYGLLVFFLQINQLLGEGILWKFIGGKYHQPREEERIFMFLDMKSSTTIAEQLGHVRFYALLN